MTSDWRRIGMVALALGAGGCTTPVAAALDEEDANRVVVALDRSAIDATKESDPTAEGKFRVMVARDDASQALTTLREEELPRPRHRGVLESMDKGALVPSQAAEHAQLTAGLAGDLQRTLEGVEGVLSARVHLNLPSPDPLRDTAQPKSTASVLISYRGSTPPIADAAVQRVVSGGVPSLAPADVSVVMVSRPSPAVGSQSQLSHVGPLAVSRGSLRPLQIGLTALSVLVALFAATTLAFYIRIVRLRGEANAAKAASPS
jgi:type III secretion protein J